MLQFGLAKTKTGKNFTRFAKNFTCKNHNFLPCLCIYRGLVERLFFCMLVFDVCAKMCGCIEKMWMVISFNMHVVCA